MRLRVRITTLWQVSLCRILQSFTQTLHGTGIFTNQLGWLVDLWSYGAYASPRQVVSGLGLDSIGTSDFSRRGLCL